MSITFIEKTENTAACFLLETPQSRYCIAVVADGVLAHGGWYRKLGEWSGNCAPHIADRGLAQYDDDPRNFSLDTLAQEFPTSGFSDLRPGAIELELPDGTNALSLRYESYSISRGKPALEGLPSTYVEIADEADTLQITLRDTLYDVQVQLFYTVWRKRDVICRWVQVKNLEKAPVRIRKLMSASLDFPTADYDMLQLSGAWARERSVYIRALCPGTQSIESRRGSSSHQQNPFVALCSKNADEDSGEVFAFNFVYSGNFLARADVDYSESTRMSMGINPYNFCWNLPAGETFTAPEVVMVYSPNGLGEMSRTLHDLYRERLCRGSWKTKERPVVINNWEATYFDFTAQKLCALADKASKAGVELFVLDDGWFGNRFDDKRALGDWVVNMEKLPGGLERLASEMQKRKMGFGLWVEPEMVCPDSDLYRKHPDWCLRIPGRKPGLARTQLVLDLSRDDIVDWLFETLSGVFRSAPLAYVKWDFNRHLADVYSSSSDSIHQQEVSHRYVLGLYKLLERITQAFPEILFEGCSSGGGRFDPGILHYMPQIWTSDNTDALSRIYIQAGTSLVYPASAMSCHVSIVPNHQTGRVTPLAQRAHTAMAGAYGYELDMTRLSDEELAEIGAYSERYKMIRSVVQFGDLYRLVTPWAQPRKSERYCAWMNVAKDKSMAVVTVSWIYSESFAPKLILRLKGLAPDGRYRNVATGIVYTGGELMSAGVPLMNNWSSAQSLQIILERVDNS